MRADEEVAPPESGHVVVHHSAQPHVFETLHLHAVMHDVAQRIHLAARLGQCRLGFRDGSHHAEAKTRITVYLHVHVKTIKQSP